MAGVQAHGHGIKEHKLEELKYLGFLVVGVSMFEAMVVRVYYMAKEWMGAAWREKIEIVEKKLKEVIGPLYAFVEGKEFDILLFVDHQVGCVANFIYTYSPHFYNTTVATLHKIPDVATDFVAHIAEKGAKEAILAYLGYLGPHVEHFSHKVLRSAIKLPFGKITLTHVVSPIGHSFNVLLSKLQAMHFPVVGIIPHFPLHHIETVLKTEVIKKEA